jgi:chorismate mutase
MRRFNNGNANLEYLEFNSAKANDLPDAASLPTLASKQVMNALLEGEPKDTEPYFVTEAIDFPALGSGGVYQGSFFNSFLSKIANRPIGGNKLGHYDSDSKNDLYTIGGKVVNGKGDTGTAYFKIFVPQMGYETSNFGLIRDFKARNVRMSLVTQPEVEQQQSPVTGEMVNYFTASNGFERNDVVSEGAMAQRLSNHDEPEDEYEQAKKLVAAGQFEYNGKIEGDGFIQNGKVYYTALRRLSLAANGKSVDPRVSELMSLIDKYRKNAADDGKDNSMPKQAKENHNMDDIFSLKPEEIYKVINARLATGALTPSQLANGIETQYRDNIFKSENDKSNAALVKQLNERMGTDNPIGKLDELLENQKQVEKDLVEQSVIAKFGPAKQKNASGDLVDNPCYIRAMELCKGKHGKELNDALTASANDALIKMAKGMQADMNSKFNRIEGSSPINNNAVIDA